MPDTARKIWKREYYQKVRLQIIYTPPVNLNGVSKLVDTEDSFDTTVFPLNIIQILCHALKIPVARLLSNC